MPDPTPLAPDRFHRTACAAVEAWAQGWSGGALTASQLADYAGRGIVAGWRLEVEFSDGAKRRLDLLLDKGFPRTAARVALVDRPAFLAWPHVEKDGVLCLLHGASEVSPFAPLAAVERVLGEASNLVEDLIAGRLDGDFRAEFLSYWDWSATPGAQSVRSLLEPHGPSRIVRVWRGRDRYIVGETDEALSTWLTTVRQVGRPRTDGFDPALLAWRDAPLTPAEYPRSGHALDTLLDPAARETLREMAACRPDRLVVVLGFPTDNGAAFGAVTLRAPTEPRRGGPRPQPVEKGFRPGKAPPALVAARYLAGAAVVRASVDRVDASWIHGRDQDPRQARLAASRVTLVGCGSVGGPVALLLAEAGVGFVRTVDPQTLVAANLGRHPLGARRLGEFKATGLAEEIQQRLPHVRTEAHNLRWEDLPPGVDVFADSDLVISAVGSWAAEGGLNGAHLARGRPAPVLYGWTEAHACAGHAVLVGTDGGCLQCGFDAVGTPKLTATAWPEGHELKQEPACGAVYQPYGPVELNHIVSVIAELALDALMGEVTASAHRTWSAGERRLKALGGDWSPEWLAHAGVVPTGGGVLERPWAAEPACPQCGRKAAAA